MCNKDLLSKRLIYLDSIKRSSGSIEDLVFDIHPQLTNVRGYEILDFSLSKSPIYNVNSGCNILDWEDTTATQITSVIPIQSYSPTQLAEELTNIMNTEQNGLAVYTVTYDNQTGKYTFDVDGAIPFELITSSTTNSVYSKMGFDTTFDLIGLLSYTSQNVADINGLMFIYLKSRNITNILMDAPRTIGLLANSVHRVTIDKPFGEELTDSKIQFPVFINCSDNSRISEIDVKLVDCNGVDIDMNGINWSLTIMVYYENMKTNLINKII